MNQAIDGLYGAPPRDLAVPPEGAVQFSPLYPGAAPLEGARLSSMTMLAPPGAAERLCALALALRALEPGATLVAMAPKDKGGTRLRKELEGFGCAVVEDARRHHRICTVERPAALSGIEAAIAAGALRLSAGLGLWTQPGVFSWDRIDAGTQALIEALPPLKGAGADFGCGIGVVARHVLTVGAVQTMALVDIDRRAIAAARRNVDDERASFHWADVTEGEPGLERLDFVVMNPPFHDAGTEDRELGQRFVRRAAQALKTGGACWMVANRHLPYERVLGDLFARAETVREAAGFKVLVSRK